MKKTAILIIIWIPRVTGILFILFISLFALDVFSEGYNFLETLTALFMHLLSTFILTIALILAWKQKMSGALLFIAYGVWYLIETGGELSWIAFLMAGVPIIIGVLLIVSRILQRKVHNDHS